MFIYHIFTNNLDEWTTNEDEAYKIYQYFLAGNDCARLYIEEKDQDDETINEECLESYGQWPM